MINELLKQLRTFYALFNRLVLSGKILVGFLILVPLVSILSGCQVFAFPVGETSTPAQEVPTQQSPTGISEQVASSDPNDITTPVPTMTPGPIEDFIIQSVLPDNVVEGTFLGLSVEGWIHILISVLYVLVGWTIGVWLVKSLLRFGFRQTSTKFDDEFFNLIMRQISWMVMVFSLFLATRRIYLLSDSLRIILQNIYFIIFFGILFSILWQLVSFSLKWYQGQLGPDIDTERVHTIIMLVDRTMRVALVTVFIMILLEHFGIGITGLTAVLAIIGLSLSFAAQDTLSDAISGFIILIDQPYRIGDRIEISGLDTWGDVVDIGTRTTRIRTLDNRLVIVPNSSIGKSQVVNYTFPDSRYRVEMDIGIGYGQDIEKIRQVIKDAVRDVSGVLPDKPVDAIYQQMGDSAMIFRVRWWIETFADTPYLFNSVNTALQNSFDEVGIEMPFNAYDIYLKNSPGEKDNNHE